MNKAKGDTLDLVMLIAETFSDAAEIIVEIQRRSNALDILQWLGDQIQGRSKATEIERRPDLSHFDLREDCNRNYNGDVLSQVDSLEELLHLHTGDNG